MNGAISEVEVNQILIGHAELRRKRLEIAHGRLIQANRDRLLEAGTVGIPLSLHFREIVLGSHSVTSDTGQLPAALLF